MDDIERDDDDLVGNQEDAPLPGCPTGYPPGSPQKVNVLRERCRHRCQLHHPEDSLALTYERPQIERKPCAPRGPLPLRRPDGTERGVGPHQGRGRGFLANKHVGLYDNREEAEAAVLAYWRERGRDG